MDMSSRFNRRRSFSKTRQTGDEHWESTYLRGGPSASWVEVRPAPNSDSPREIRTLEQGTGMRPTRDEVLMETARLWAHRGTCNRLRVGAVFSRRGRVLVQGYNGAPSGMLHCDHQNGEPCTRAVHAEANGISWAARNGVSLEDSEVHITNLPCPNCSLLIINSGIIRVVYDQDYRIRDGIELLAEANLEVVRYDSITA